MFDPKNKRYLILYNIFGKLLPFIAKTHTFPFCYLCDNTSMTEQPQDIDFKKDFVYVLKGEVHIKLKSLIHIEAEPQLMQLY